MSLPCTDCARPTIVLDSRSVTLSPGINAIRRRRGCTECRIRFTTYEILQGGLLTAQSLNALIQISESLASTLNTLLHHYTADLGKNRETDRLI